MATLIETQSLHSCSSKRTLTTNATHHDVQGGTDVTNIERTEFLKKGYCPFHPDIQLKKRGRILRRWKTVLRECPRCAADFMMRQMVQMHQGGSTMNNIPAIAVLERQGSVQSEATSSLGCSSITQHKYPEQSNRQLPSLLSPRSTSTLSKTSVVSRQIKDLYSPEALHRDDSSVVEVQSSLDAPLARTVQLQDSITGSELVLEPDTDSVASKSSTVQKIAAAFKPFSRNLDKESHEGDTVALKHNESTISALSAREKWKKMFGRRNNLGTDDDDDATEGSRRSKSDVLAGAAATGTTAALLLRPFSRSRAVETRGETEPSRALSGDHASEERTANSETDQGTSETPLLLKESDGGTEVEGGGSSCTEATPDKGLDPVFEPLVKRVYNQVDVLERTNSPVIEDSLNGHKMKTTPQQNEEQRIEGSKETQQEGTDETEQEATHTESTPQEVSSKSCRILDFLTPTDPFSCGTRSETEELLDSVPSADRHTRTWCIGLDSVC